MVEQSTTTIRLHGHDKAIFWYYNTRTRYFPALKKRELGVGGE